MYMRIYGKIGIVLNWDKNFSLISINSDCNDHINKKTSKNNLLTDSCSIEHMALVPKGLIRRIMVKDEQCMYFYTYSYHGEKDQYTIALVGDERFVLFLNLLKVQQVGPKLACLIASEFDSLSSFFEVINKNDYKRLAQISGLGTKKAGLIVWHFSREGAKELLKMESMQYNDIYESILDKLAIALYSLGIPKREAKDMIKKKHLALVKFIDDHIKNAKDAHYNNKQSGIFQSQDSSFNNLDIGRLIRIVLRNK